MRGAPVAVPQDAGVVTAGVVGPGPGGDELVDVVVELWTSAAPVGGAPAPPVPGPWPRVRTPVVRALVAVEGVAVGRTRAADWSGDVLVACTAGAARRWARHLLALGADDPLDDDDVRDVLGEVANVVAGAVKARCAPGGLMGLPRVVDRPSPLGPRGAGVVATALRWSRADRRADEDADVTVVALVGR
ncbi:chemotaxis protein CheX [Pseudokineococcus basanitobsidens]|uniref:Chemotaxis protein CheX n=1 Tax=Pseudokineococcus basanitobsidens TaxID=1926649 RepID=A0ABU8RG15_9ACTN